MLRVNSAKQALRIAGFAVLLLTAATGVALAADASAPDASSSAPAAAPGSVQAVMAMASKVAQQQLADKDRKSVV